MRGHTGNRLSTCVGCQQGISPREWVLQYAFATTRFDTFKRCNTVYPSRCFRVGPPFISQRANQQGLHFPTNISDWPNFICKACTVCQILQLELHGPEDISLLALERMRILDIVSSWAKSTHGSYQTQLRSICRFERHHDFIFLQATKLSLRRPLSGFTRWLIWCLMRRPTKD